MAPPYGATATSWSNQKDGDTDSIGISDAGADSRPPGLESVRVGVGVDPGLQAAATAASARIARSRFSINHLWGSCCPGRPLGVSSASPLGVLVTLFTLRGAASRLRPPHGRVPLQPPAIGMSLPAGRGRTLRFAEDGSPEPQDAARGLAGRRSAAFRGERPSRAIFGSHGLLAGNARTRCRRRQGLSRQLVIDQLRRGRSGSDADVLQLSETVVPLPGPSMRIFEFLIASAAIAVALLLGFTH
jgi:hypothetical protein